MEDPKVAKCINTGTRKAGAEASRALLHMKEATEKNKQEKNVTEPSVISTSSHQNVIETNRCMVFE